MPKDLVTINDLIHKEAERRAGLFVKEKTIEVEKILNRTDVPTCDGQFNLFGGLRSMENVAIGAITRTIEIELHKTLFDRVFGPDAQEAKFVEQVTSTLAEYGESIEHLQKTCYIGSEQPRIDQQVHDLYQQIKGLSNEIQGLEQKYYEHKNRYHKGK